MDPEPEVDLPIASSHKVAVVMGCSRNTERAEFVCSVQVGILKYFVLNESLLEYSRSWKKTTTQACSEYLYKENVQQQKNWITTP